MESKARERISNVVRFFGPITVGVVIKNAIVATTPKDLNLINRISVEIGSWVIATVVADVTVEYIVGEINRTIDEIEKKAEELKAKQNPEAA